MKTSLVLTLYVIICAYSSRAQGVTQLNNNNSLQVQIPLSNGKTILRSGVDSSIWATDGTPGNTVQISPDIKIDESADGAPLSGKVIFRGSTAATGSELYITDGTPGGTVLVRDINSGAASSAPEGFSLLSGFIYFSADDGVHGRELWRTDGTAAGTTLVKDIEPGAVGSFDENIISGLFTNGSYLLFAANTTGSGDELWKSDGTAAGTVLLKEINTGNSNADSSNPREFYPYNNMVLFLATDATHGEELWKTDGTSGGTVLVKDINPGAGSSTTFDLSGSPFPLFQAFHTFKNHVYFNADDGTSTGEIWSTDGTTANTILLKDVIPGTSFSTVSMILAENLPNKFIFSVSDHVTRSELWESDGTPAGTQLFKAFSVVNTNKIPFIFPSFVINPTTGTVTYPLFQGNKFFFSAATTAEGNELWVSDGTLPGTIMVKDIFAGTGNGIDGTKSVTFLYTSTAFYFAATDSTHGDELWKTDGTDPGTSMVADINPNAGDADPRLPIFVCNGKIIFSAGDGEDTIHTDLYAVIGNFQALPVKLTDFTVSLKTKDALLEWSTAQELNTKNFTIQRSYDAPHFEDIGNVQASGTSSNRHAYSFIDAGIVNSGKSIVYYRLVVSDIDGKSENSNVISLKLKGNSHWDVHLLSNPVQDNVNVILSGTTGIVQFSIHDINGKMIYAKSLQNVNGQISLPVTLQKGVYILEAENNNERKTLQFVK